MPSVSKNTPGKFDDAEVRLLYLNWLDAWNKRDADAMARLVSEKGIVVGFDGSQMHGAAEISATLGKIFADHPTAEYVGIIREVRFLAPDEALLTADAGMVPHESSDIDPGLNSVQSLVGSKRDDTWRIELFQSTPAAFHGRPEVAKMLTDELREVLHRSRGTEMD